MSATTYDLLHSAGILDADAVSSFEGDDSHPLLRDDLEVDATTRKAVLLRPSDRADSTDEGNWVPKSVLVLDAPKVRIARWFVEKEGCDDLLE